MAIRTAIIGLGIMGRRMLDNMLVHPGFEPAILWDPNQEACRQAAKDAPGAVIAGSADAAIAGADLIYLACPPAPRKTYALAAAAAGKAIFLEKPLGIDIDESEDLVAQLDRAGVPVAVNFTQAAGPGMASVARAAKDGSLGALAGADIVVTYANWPRAWQAAADWLRFRAEGGPTREVVSHFLFFSERILGPLDLVWARPTYPNDPALCETHMAARLENREGLAVTVMVAVGGAQPDRQELTIKGEAESRLISDFYVEHRSTGGAFSPMPAGPDDPRRINLQSQLNDLVRLCRGEPTALASPLEALRVQKLVEAMLVGKA
jgi:predicted dehydrogenase